MYPLISVIVPVFNVEKYIRICVDCLLKQTYPNIEIILVDDGSNDSSGMICDHYASLYEQITVIHKANGGLSDARNVGFENSHGEYVAFLDSDDWPTPDMYQDLLDLMVLHDAQVACANYYIHQQTRPKRTYRSENVGILAMTKEDAFSSLLSFKNISNSINEKLYKREILEGISFIKGLLFEDIVHTAEVLLRTERLVYTSKPLWNYRIRNGSISHGNVQNLYDAIKARNLRYNMIKSAMPKVLPLLKHEYVYAFFYVMRQLSCDSKCSSMNKETIRKFYFGFCKEESIDLSLKEKLELIHLYLKNIVKKMSI